MKRIIIAIAILFVLPSVAFSDTATFLLPAWTTDYSVGWKKNGFSWPPAGESYSNLEGPNFYAENNNQGSGVYGVKSFFIRFNTSDLPDSAVITSATLDLYAEGISNADYKNFRGEYYAWTSISASDWTAYPGNTAFSVALSSLSSGATASISLNNVSNISKTGYTGFRFGVGIEEPSWQDYHYNSLYNTNSSQRPKLTVNYSLPFSKKIFDSTPVAVFGVSNPMYVLGIQ